MKMKKVAMTLVTLCIMTLSATDATVSANVKEKIFQKEAAITLAKSAMPADANFLGAKSEEGRYHIMGQDPNDLSYYTIHVDMKTNMITDIEIVSSNFPGSVTITKTPEEIINVIKAAYPSAQDIVVDKELDPNANNLIIYKATFATAKYKAKAQLNPHTGCFGYRFFEAK